MIIKQNVEIRNNIIFDTLSVIFILLFPGIAHISNINISVIEPFRLVLFSSIYLKSRYNTLFLAATIPYITYLTSGHPYFLKTMLISVELIINAILLYEGIKRYNNIFVVSLFSIIISKATYYIFKYVLLSSSIISGDLISTSISLQLIIALAISIVFSITFKKNKLFNQEWI